MLKYRCYKREVSVLATTLVEFQNIPKFGFAHHVYTENICQVQKDIQHSFVLVYVKSGHLTAHIYDRTLEAPAGSVLILFRHVPFQLSSPWNTPQDYCSIQVYTDYSFTILEDGEDFPPDFAGLALPLVVPPTKVPPPLPSSWLAMRMIWSSVCGLWAVAVTSVKWSKYSSLCALRKNTPSGRLWSFT
jgi:hypothetical protein